MGALANKADNRLYVFSQTLGTRADLCIAFCSRKTPKSLPAHTHTTNYILLVYPYFGGMPTRFDSTGWIARPHDSKRFKCFHFSGGWKYYVSCSLRTILCKNLTCAQYTCVNSARRIGFCCVSIRSSPSSSSIAIVNTRSKRRQ